VAHQGTDQGAAVQDRPTYLVTANLRAFTPVREMGRGVRSFHLAVLLAGMIVLLATETTLQCQWSTFLPSDGDKQTIFAHSIRGGVVPAVDPARPCHWFTASDASLLGVSGSGALIESAERRRHPSYSQENSKRCALRPNRTIDVVVGITLTVQISSVRVGDHQALCRSCQD